jgi:hypothetical protein
MDDLQNALRRRFPLLTSLRIFHGPGDTEDLAAFMGVLLAAMEGSHGSSFCFVFPRKYGLATLSATLYALGRFAVDFPKLAEQYARQSFNERQRIRLIPEDKVFEFGGVWPGLETCFRLKLLNDKRNTSFTFPISEILRIEPTERKIPKGREDDISRARREAPLSILDRLTGTRTFGNLSLAANYVLLLGGRTDTEDVLGGTSLAGSALNIHSTLDRLVVPGSINESGAIKHQDNYQAAGEPLVAISGRLENVAAACSLAPPGSKVVVVDGARRITDLARFDAIAESQNLIILAEADEEEKLQQFHDRGCKFWRFSLSDLEMGNSEQQHGQFFNGVFRSARNESTFRTEVFSCRNSNLEEVTRALEVCQASLDESEGDETQQILGQIYGLLMHCTSLLAPPDSAEQVQLLERVEILSASAGDRIMWLQEVAAKALKDAFAAITRAIQDPELGRAKGNVLRELLGDLYRQGEIGPVAVVARSVSNRRSVARWLEKEGLTCPVLLPAKVAEGGFFGRLICTVWPGSGSFSRVVQKFSAPQVCLIAYPFENRWLYWFGQKQRNNQVVPSLTSSEKSRLLGLAEDTSWPAVQEPPAFAAADGETTAHSKFDLEERITRKGMIPVGSVGEETTPASLVSFSGDAYAFLTDNFRMPVITDLVSGGAGVNYKVPRRRLAEIHAGDVLVFREGGRRDVIQALADAQLGPEAPAIRERAARWHRALRESGLDESTLMAELEEVKCPRTLQTVRGWLADDSLIGPQTRVDLEAIAYAVGDQQLLDDVPFIWDAIHVLRGEHLSAGMRLSRILLEKLPERLEEIQEGRTRVEIDNATSAWIVQVESISDRAGIASAIIYQYAAVGHRGHFLRCIHGEDDTAALARQHTAKRAAGVQFATERSPDNRLGGASFTQPETVRQTALWRSGLRRTHSASRGLLSGG